MAFVNTHSAVEPDGKGDQDVSRRCWATADEVEPGVLGV